MADGRKHTKNDFESKLDTGADRFLARALVQVFADDWRRPSDFLDRFKPAQIMEALATAPKLRAELLVGAAGVHEKIARKKSTSSAAEDLKIALEEGICTAQQVLDLIPPDDRVRYLDKAALWALVTDDQFYKAPKVDANRDRAIDRMAFLLEIGLSEKLLSLEELADGIGFETVVENLPAAELQRLMTQALKLGRKGKPFNEEELLNLIELPRLVSFIPLEHIWTNVIVSRIAVPTGLAEATGTGPTKTADASPADKQAGAVQGKETAPSKPPAKPKAAAASSPSISDQDIDMEVDELFQANGDRTPQEEEARRKVIEKLSAIDRLPPKHGSLSTAILLSIESMYAELFTLTEDDEREECIHESFPNEAHLTQAMLGLIELLDPSIDISDPVIRDADVDSLIKVVLFEERQRAEKGRGSQHPSAPPKPGAQRPSAPPPLPPNNGKRART